MKRNVIVGVSVVVVLVVAVIVAVALYLKYRTPAASKSSTWSTYGPANPPTPTMIWDDTSSTWSGSFTVVNTTVANGLFLSGSIAQCVFTANVVSSTPTITTDVVWATGATVVPGDVVYTATNFTNYVGTVPAAFSTVTIATETGVPIPTGGTITFS